MAKQFEIGINTNCECGDDYRKVLDAIKAAGFNNIMVSEQKGSLEETLEHAVGIGLKVPFVHLKYDMADYIWFEGGFNRVYIDSVIESIKICGKYGVKVAVMHLQRDDGQYRLLPPSKHGIACMREILEAAEIAGIKIALENLDEQNIGHVYYMLDNIKSPNLGFCFDCGHKYLYMPDTDLLKKYGDRCYAVHLHDNLMDWKLGRESSYDLHLLPGDGRINFEKVFDDLGKCGYKGVLMFEVRRTRTPTVGPQLYNNMTPAEFLAKAYEKCSKSAKLTRKYEQI